MKISIIMEALTGKFVTDTKRASAEFERNAKKMQRQAAETGKKIGTVLAAGITAGVAVAGVAFASVIRNTIEAEKVSAQLDAVLKSTGRTAPGLSTAIKAYSAELQNVTTFGDEAITSTQSWLLTFNKIGGDVFPRATKAILDASTALGTDLKSQTMQVGKALNDPIKGISALADAGIQFSDDQKAVIKSFVETGEVAKAQEIILAELETQFGGSAEAARNTFGGAIQALKNSFGDLLEGSGGNLKGVTSALNDLTDTLNDPDVKAGFGEVVSGILWITKVAVEGIGAIGGLISELRDLNKEADKKSYENLLKERLRVSEAIFTAENTGAGKAAVVVRNLFGLPTVDELKAELAKLDAEILKRNQPGGSQVSASGAVAAGVTVTPGGGSPASSAATRDGAAAAAKRQAEAERELARAIEQEAKVMEAARRKQIDIEFELSEALEREAEQRERGLQAGRDLISDLEFELELMKMSNVERATAIQLRGMDAEAVAEYGEKIKALNAELEANAKVTQQMDGLRDASSNLFEDLMSGSKSAGEAFRDFADSIIQNITRMIAQNFAESLFGNFGQTGGGSFGNVAQSLFGGLFGGGRAGGGPVAAGTPYLVGENGPEMFVPSTAGRITNSSETRRMGGGSVINISVEGQVDMRSRQQLAADVGRASQKSLARSY